LVTICVAGSDGVNLIKLLGGREAIIVIKIIHVTLFGFLMDRVAMQKN